MDRNELLVAAEKTIAAQSLVPLACVKLARHVQRLYDPTPVDAQWMLSVGGALVGAFPSLSVYLGNRIEWWVSYEKTLWLGDQEICDNPTRGDVRRLCDALGVTLREEP